MEDPELELPQIIALLTENDDAKIQRRTVQRYFHPHASFTHPLVTVAGGEGSRERLMRIYGVYKFFTRDVRITIDRITVNLTHSSPHHHHQSNRNNEDEDEEDKEDKEGGWQGRRDGVAVVELSESLSAAFVPLLRLYNLKIITVLHLRQSRRDGRYYITHQYDAFPLDHASDVLPFGFLYGWYKSLAATVGDFTGAVLEWTGLW